MAATTAPSPGWYPDPQGPDHLRWWDGDGWTDHLTELPRRAAEPAFVADVADFEDHDDDPIEFSWEDEAEDFVLTVLDPEPEPEPPAPEPEPEPLAPAQPGAFAFRARALAPAPEPARRPDLPAYESPLATVSSPLPHTSSAEGGRVRPSPAAVPEPAPERIKPARSPVPRRAIKGSVGLVVCAALAAQVTNMLRDDGTSSDRAALPPATGVTAADKTCLKEWNTTASGAAAELRVTLGQFTGAYARVGRVDPLPGTLMAPDSCALTVYDPATDTNVVFVSGVPDQLGYMDVTSYPRAKSYGWPKSAAQANVAVREDGTIAAIAS